MEFKFKDFCWTKEDQLAFLESRDDIEEPNQIRISKWDHNQCVTIGKMFYIRGYTQTM